MGEPSPQAPASVQSEDTAGDVLVLGATGLVGSNVLRQLALPRGRVLATTRGAQPPPALAEQARWHCGASWDLDGPAAAWPSADSLLSAGPLDALARWLERVRPAGLRRLVALGSTSVAIKRDSPDPAERGLADRLKEAEERLVTVCEQIGVAWTLLRPTLIWGEGRDRNVSRLAVWARRLGFLPVPSFATGRRQPIRAADVASALIAAMRRPSSAGLRLDLPGGEILGYDEMARRIAAAVRPPGRVLRLPGAPLAWCARLGIVSPGAFAALERMRRDLVFPDDPARQALDWRPAGFAPVAGDFPTT